MIKCGKYFLLGLSSELIVMDSSYKILKKVTMNTLIKKIVELNNKYICIVGDMNSIFYELDKNIIVINLHNFEEVINYESNFECLDAIKAKQSQILSQN
jgi:hypothetical protein